MGVLLMAGVTAGLGLALAVVAAGVVTAVAVAVTERDNHSIRDVRRISDTDS